MAGAGLARQNLSCNEILLNLDGMIKIGRLGFLRCSICSVADPPSACLEAFTESSPGESHVQFTASIPSITMALMQKEEKGLGIAGVHDVKRWPVDSDAVGFLSAASVAGTIQKLQTVSVASCG